MKISKKGKTEALALARWALEYYIDTNSSHTPSISDPILNEMRGVFVTLTIAGELRGCVGTLEPVQPLKETICDIAVKSATRDPRFTPLKPEEIKDVRIEISILTPHEPIQNPNQIKVGEDGLMVEKGDNRGVLLPQVAVEEQWDSLTFLEHTCLKAGIPKDAWKDKDCQIFRFQAVILSEENGS